MKRYYILLMSTLLMLGLCQPILAQDDDYEEVEVATVAKKKTPAKRPTYPMMEVTGVLSSWETFMENSFRISSSCFIPEISFMTIRTVPFI